MPAEKSDEPIGVRVLYTGRVQGVGFRYRTEALAGNFAVTGYVKNLPDGRVEMVAQGVRSELDGLLAAIEQELVGYIRDRQVNEQPVSASLQSFSIRY